MKLNLSITFILAGYNEAENVKDTVEETWRVLNENFTDFEIILIDDASKDNTLKIMHQCAQSLNNIRIVENNINLNFGTSILRGLKLASKDYVVYNAFDLPLRPDVFIVKFKEFIATGKEIAILQRQGYKTTSWRKVTSIFNQALLKILFPKLTEKTPCLNFTQIYKTEIIDKIIPLARSPIFVWPEMVFRAKLKNISWTNIITPCNVKNVRKGAFGHPHDIIWGIYDMIRFRIRLWKNDI